jgi:tetratricopeptide (TPR) repeat protein
MRIRHHSIPVVVTVLFLGILSPALADDYEDASRLLSQGKQAAALKKVDAAIASNPQDARARFLKGLILTEQNNMEAAIQVFTLLTRDYPELPEPYNNLAVLYAAQGQYDRAQESLEMAIRTHPSYAVAHENLGDVYAKMASEAYDKALSLDRSNQTAQTKLALIRELFGGATMLASEPAQTVATTQAAPEPAAAPAPAPAKISFLLFTGFCPCRDANS